MSLSPCTDPNNYKSREALSQSRACPLTSPRFSTHTQHVPPGIRTIALITQYTGTEIRHTGTSHLHSTPAQHTCTVHLHSTTAVLVGRRPYFALVGPPPHRPSLAQACRSVPTSGRTPTCSPRSCPRPHTSTTPTTTSRVWQLRLVRAVQLRVFLGETSPQRRTHGA